MLRDEIKNTVKRLDIAEYEFKELGKYQWEHVQRNIEEAFIYKKAYNANVQPYWNNLNGKYPNVSFAMDEAFKFLEVISDLDEKVWFLAQDTDRIWLYEGNVKSILKIIKESYAFEYYLVSKHLSWLLCENHHGSLIGVGGYIVDKMTKVQNQMGIAN